MDKPRRPLFAVTLARGALRQTPPRQQVLEVFASHPERLPVAEVHARLRDPRINLASVYRAIHRFCSLGILVTAGHVPAGQTYELSDDYRAHHHHLICERCGTVTDIEECRLKPVERRIRRQTGFHVRRHDLRFYGVCPTCAAR
jgi:Fur family ferric uptake transcriptional regulator